MNINHKITEPKWSVIKTSFSVQRWQQHVSSNNLKIMRMENILMQWNIILRGFKNENFDFIWADRYPVYRCINVSLYYNGDAYRCRWTTSAMVQVMACCLTAPIHCQSQCCFIIAKIRWHLTAGNFTKKWRILHEHIQNHIHISFPASKDPRIDVD